VITGGSKGLGRAMAQRFAASGADVAILARTPETLAAAKQQIQAGAKGKVATVSADVSKVADIRRAYDQVMSELGKIDILVNNAGQATSGPSEEVTDEMWQADLGQPWRANGVLQGARGRGCPSQHPGQLIACRGHRQRPDRSPSLGRNRLFVAPR
jgi:NADP-dependent 3-hydroxy acid dehydrogenase YdfG